MQSLLFQSMRVHQRSSLAYALHVPLLWWNHPSPGWSWKWWKVWWIIMDDYDDSAKIGDETSGKHEQNPNTSWTLAPQPVLSPSLSSGLRFLVDRLWHSPSWNPFFPCCPSLHHQKPWCILNHQRSSQLLKLLKSPTLNPIATKELVECCPC